MVELSVVLANYNQAHHLARCFERVERTLALLDVETEYLLVDDGSTDATWREMEAIAAGRPAVRLLRQPRNFGRGRAVADGLRAARGAYVGTLDTDLEVPPHYLLPLLLAVRDGADLALARRHYAAPLHWARTWELGRWLAHRSFRVFTRALLGVPTDTATGCKVVRRAAVLPLLEEIRDSRWFWDTELAVRAARAGLKVVEVTAYCEGKPRERSTFATLSEAAKQGTAALRLRRELAGRAANGLARGGP